MLMILTSGFPYGGEPFLKTEYIYSPDDTVFVSLGGEKDEPLPNFNRECFAVNIKERKLFLIYYLISAIFDLDFWHELFFMIKKRKISLKTLMRLMGFYCGSLRCVKQIKKSLGDKDISIIYSYWMSYHALVAIKLKKIFPKAKVITRCHGYDVYEYRSYKDYLPFRELILNEMDKIFPISCDGKEYILRKYGDIINQKTEVHRLGTSRQKVYDYKKQKKFTIVSCSNIVEIKRIDKLINALSLIKGLNIKWVHFGDGVLSDKIQSKASRQLTSIDFQFKGHLENHRILEWYENNQVDLFINCSESEGIPVSIMEALSFGIPVIATNVGGTSEVVIDGYNGFLIDKDFLEIDLKQMIVDFLNSSEDFILEKRTNARIFWENNYDAEKNYTEFYKRIEGLEI